jgi:hypothetical protein
VTPPDNSERPVSQPDEDAQPTSTTTRTVEDGSADDSADSSGEDSTSSESSSEGSSEGLFVGSDAPPPWHRATAPPSGGSQGKESRRVSDGEQTQQIPRPSSGVFGATGDDDQRSGERGSAVSFAETHTSSRPNVGTSGRRTSRGPRRASLQVKRVDPWSVLKLALVLSVALFFVWMIAVAVLYGVLDGMGVWDQLNGTFTELTQPANSVGQPLISAGRVFSIAAVVGLINAVLMTALATVAAFIYNVASDVAGGIEVTLSERE